MDEAPAVRIGDRRFGYSAQPLGADGFAVHGGNHYANPETIEAAREYAARVIGSRIWYCQCRAEVAAVEVVGEWWEFTGSAWKRVGPYEEYTFEIVRAGGVIEAGRGATP